MNHGGILNAIVGSATIRKHAKVHLLTVRHDWVSAHAKLHPRHVGTERLQIEFNRPSMKAEAVERGASSLQDEKPLREAFMLDKLNLTLWPHAVCSQRMPSVCSHADSNGL